MIFAAGKMKNNNTLLGYIAIMFSMLFWGVSFVWTKQLLNADFPVCTIVLFRLVIASAIFVTFFKLRGKLEKIRSGDGRLFLWLAIFEPFLYFIGEDFGLKYVDASFASVMIALIPIVVSVTMYFCEREPLSWRLLAGTLISIFGISLMTFNPSNALSFSWKGFSLLLIALFSAGGYSVLLVRLLKNYGPVTVTTYQNLMAIPLYLPLVCVFDIRFWSGIQWSTSSIFNLVCLAVFCSAGAYMLYSYAAKQISITKLSVFTNAIPIVTILVASLLGLEMFTMRKFVGIVVVAAGVLFSQMKNNNVKTSQNGVEC